MQREISEEQRKMIGEEMDHAQEAALDAKMAELEQKINEVKVLSTTVEAIDSNKVENDSKPELDSSEEIPDEPPKKTALDFVPDTEVIKYRRSQGLEVYSIVFFTSLI